MSDIVDRLRGLAPVTNAETRAAMEEAADEIERQAAELRSLRAALEPFAAEADCWPDHHDDEPLVESFPEYDGKITVGACRRARAALEGK